MLTKKEIFYKMINLHNQKYLYDNDHNSYKNLAAGYVENYQTDIAHDTMLLYECSNDRFGLVLRPSGTHFITTDYPKQTANGVEKAFGHDNCQFWFWHNSLEMFIMMKDGEELDNWIFNKDYYND